jgi:hypothetical protein
MERNLAHHTKTGGFFQHFGKDNRIQNNFFAFGTQFQLEGIRPESHVSFHFERNIVFWDNNSAPAGACDAGPAKFTIITDGNKPLCDEWITEPARQSPAPKAQPDYSIVALINWRRSRLS